MRTAEEQKRTLYRIYVGNVNVQMKGGRNHILCEMCVGIEVSRKHKSRADVRVISVILLDLTMTET